MTKCEHERSQLDRFENGIRIAFQCADCEEWIQDETGDREEDK